MTDATQTVVGVAELARLRTEALRAAKYDAVMGSLRRGFPELYRIVNGMEKEVEEAVDF